MLAVLFSRRTCPGQTSLIRRRRPAVYHLIRMRPTIPDLPSGVFQGLINVGSRCLFVVFLVFFSGSLLLEERSCPYI